MSNGAAKLACSGYFLGRPRSCLTKAKEAKVAKGDLAMGSIGVISARDICVWDVSGGLVSAAGLSAGGTCVDAGVSSISS